MLKTFLIGAVGYPAAVLIPQNHDTTSHPHRKLTSCQLSPTTDPLGHMGDPVGIPHRLAQFIRCDRQISLHSCAPLWNKKDCDTIYNM